MLTARRKKLLAIPIFITLCLCTLFIVSVFIGQKRDSQRLFTFKVTVPSNTPITDTVHVYINSLPSKQMRKTAAYSYELTLTEKQLEAQPGTELKYRYSRNGADYHGAEYLEPDTNDYFWTQKGRKAIYQPGKVQTDKVVR